MGLMDKFKNLFTDEEIEDEDEFDEPVKIKEVKKEEHKKPKDKLPTFMREKIEKEEKKTSFDNDDISDFKINKDIIKDFDNDNNDIEKNEEEKAPEVQSKPDNFKFPFEFEESDFVDVSRVSRHSRNQSPDLDEKIESLAPKIKQKKEEPKKEIKVAELYKDKREVPDKNSKKFQATPIISPIYGVLDKNYRKEELEPFSGDNYEMNRPSKNIDFDSVRKKAYGSNKNEDSLTEEIKNNMLCENCDYYKNAKSCKKDLDEDNLMYEALCEKVPEDSRIENDITLDEATENYYDYGVEYEKKIPQDDYITLDEDEEIEEEEVKIVNHEEKPSRKTKKKDVPPVKSSINLLSTLKKSMDGEEEDNNNNKEKNLELTDDLFNLIDSMYDEGNE